MSSLSLLSLLMLSWLAIGQAASVTQNSVTTEVDSPEDISHFLQNTRLFRNQPTDVVSKIAHVVKVKTYLENEPIIQQDTSGDTFFIIRKGKGIVMKRAPGSNVTEVVGSLNEGDYFGERALLEDVCRTASVNALSDVEVLTVNREHFKQLFSNMRELRTRDYGDDISTMRRAPCPASV